MSIRLQVVLARIAGERGKRANVGFSKSPLPGNMIADLHLGLRQNYSSEAGTNETSPALLPQSSETDGLNSYRFAGPVDEICRCRFSAN